MLVSLVHPLFWHDHITRPLFRHPESNGLNGGQQTLVMVVHSLGEVCSPDMLLFVGGEGQSMKEGRTDGRKEGTALEPQTRLSSWGQPPWYHVQCWVIYLDSGSLPGLRPDASLAPGEVARLLRSFVLRTQSHQRGVGGWSGDGHTGAELELVSHANHRPGSRHIQINNVCIYIYITVVSE